MIIAYIAFGISVIALIIASITAIMVWLNNDR
jgi:hypothetical protein